MRSFRDFLKERQMGFVETEQAKQAIEFIEKRGYDLKTEDPKKFRKNEKLIQEVAEALKKGETPNLRDLYKKHF